MLLFLYLACGTRAAPSVKRFEGRWEHVAPHGPCLEIREGGRVVLSDQPSIGGKVRVEGAGTLAPTEEGASLRFVPESIVRDRYIYPCRERIDEGGPLGRWELLGATVAPGQPVDLGLTLLEGDRLRLCGQECAELKRAGSR